MKHSQYISGFMIGLICSVSPLSAMAESQQSTHESSMTTLQRLLTWFKPSMTQSPKKVFPEEIGSLKVNALFVGKGSSDQYEVILNFQNNAYPPMILAVRVNEAYWSHKRRTKLQTLEEYIRFILELNEKDADPNLIKDNFSVIINFSRDELSQENLYQIVHLCLFGTMWEKHSNENTSLIHKRTQCIKEAIECNSIFNDNNRDYIYKKIFNSALLKYKKTHTEYDFIIAYNLYHELISHTGNFAWVVENAPSYFVEKLLKKDQVAITNRVFIETQNNPSNENSKAYLQFTQHILNVDFSKLEPAIREKKLSNYAWILQSQYDITEKVQSYIDYYKKIESDGIVEEKIQAYKKIETDGTLKEEPRRLNTLLMILQDSTGETFRKNLLLCIDFLREIYVNNINIDLIEINPRITEETLFNCFLLSRNITLLNQFLDGIQAKQGYEYLGRHYINKPILGGDKYILRGDNIKINLARRETPLIFAAAQGDGELMDLLIKRGANINHVREENATNKKTRHSTPLVALIEESKDNVECLLRPTKELIKQGALCQHKSADGLIHAAEYGDAIYAAIKHDEEGDILACLLYHLMETCPKNLYVTDRYGNSYLEIAAEESRTFTTQNVVYNFMSRKTENASDSMQCRIKQFVCDRYKKNAVSLVNNVLYKFQKNPSIKNIEECLKHKNDIIDVDCTKLDSAIRKRTLSDFALIVKNQCNIDQKTLNYINRHKNIGAGGTLEEETQTLNTLLMNLQYSIKNESDNSFKNNLCSYINFIKRTSVKNINIDLRKINSYITDRTLFTSLLLSKHIDLLQQYLDDFQNRYGSDLLHKFINRPIITKDLLFLEKHELFLERGSVAINIARGETPLIFAAAQGDRGLMGLLIKKGANINHVRERNSEDRDWGVTLRQNDIHRTALVALIEESEDNNQALKSLKFLIKKGALCQHKSADDQIYLAEWGDAIYAAIKYRRVKMLKFILENVLKKSPENLLLVGFRNRPLSTISYFNTICNNYNGEADKDDDRVNNIKTLVLGASNRARVKMNGAPVNIESLCADES